MIQVSWSRKTEQIDRNEKRNTENRFDLFSLNSIEVVTRGRERKKIMTVTKEKSTAKQSSEIKQTAENIIQ